VNTAALDHAGAAGLSTAAAREARRARPVILLSEAAWDRHLEAFPSAAQRLHAFPRALLCAGVAPYITNVRAAVGLLAWPDLVLPLTVGRRSGPQEAYTVGLRSQYVEYPKEEWRRNPTPGLRAAGQVGLGCLGALLQLAAPDRVVLLDNWLLSTNLHPQDLGVRLSAAVAACRRTFPSHTLVLRNVDIFRHPDLCGALSQSGWRLWATRKVFYFEGARPAFLTKDAVRRDLRLLDATGNRGRLVDGDEIHETEAQRILELYQRLYLEKHSRMNVQFTEAFVRRALRERWLAFRGLRNPSGVLDGVLGLFTGEGVVSTPFVGYDTSLPETRGIYRQLVAALLQETAARRWLLNFSSGAGEFKRRRGGQAHIEYNALYWRHLPAPRRAAWALVERLVNGVGRPFLERSDR
jgi:hypothetical protein